MRSRIKYMKLTRVGCAAAEAGAALQDHLVRISLHSSSMPSSCSMDTSLGKHKLHIVYINTFFFQYKSKIVKIKYSFI